MRFFGHGFSHRFRVSFGDFDSCLDALDLGSGRLEFFVSAAYLFFDASELILLVKDLVGELALVSSGLLGTRLSLLFLHFSLNDGVGGCGFLLLEHLHGLVEPLGLSFLLIGHLREVILMSLELLKLSGCLLDLFADVLKIFLLLIDLFVDGAGLFDLRCDLSSLLFGSLLLSNGLLGGCLGGNLLLLLLHQPDLLFSFVDHVHLFQLNLFLRLELRKLLLGILKLTLHLPDFLCSRHLFRSH